MNITRMVGMISCAAFTAGWLTAAEALPITAQLTGDPRPGNPDNLIVDVTISAVDTDTVRWTIDINSPSHPDIKLDEFYFNLTGVASDYFFHDFDPTGWSVEPASVQGLGGAAFLFEALDPAGPPNAADVTNTVNLTFLMDYVGGDQIIVDALFLDAAETCSNEVSSFCGQLGAHLQSLVAGQGESDSGFALGSYGDGGGRGRTVPEPGSLLLTGLALGGVAATRKRRKLS